MKRELDGLITQMHSAGIPYTEAVRQFKKRYILEVLAQHKGNQCKAAEELGMHRNTLSRTLAELDMDTYLARKKEKAPRYADVPEVSFLRTYVREDMAKCLCFYDAADEDVVRRGRAAVDTPIDRLHALEQR